MKRRDFLKGLAAVPAVAALPYVIPVSDTPIVEAALQEFRTGNPNYLHVMEFSNGIACQKLFHENGSVYIRTKLRGQWSDWKEMANV